ncbi:hypothetical protein CDL12_09412 [Handroanthus impetiginosus]|uniref:Uncharacterized protein n=1 Tax=Handroanthus impetiginosus TaxID=429701 RepID=A0A2G9HKG4_9LAMI|nr:hypothetical protein CDL12_09412 [Handroanthus impetiginosus]
MPSTVNEVAEKSTINDEGNETEPKLKDNEQGKQKAEEDVLVEVEAQTGVSFPVMLGDGKPLNAVGLRKKSTLGFSIKIYSFATKEMYQMVIDSNVGMMVRLVIVFSCLTMSMLRKSFDEGLGASIKKLTGRKMKSSRIREALDDIKLTPTPVIEISRLPGYKQKGEIVSSVESELLCRAYICMYSGEDPFDKEAKQKFGTSLSLSWT